MVNFALLTLSSLRELTRSFEQVGSQSSIIIIRHGSAGLQGMVSLFRTLYPGNLILLPNTKALNSDWPEKGRFLEIEKGCGRRTGQTRLRRRRFSENNNFAAAGFQGMGNGTPLSSSS